MLPQPQSLAISPSLGGLGLPASTEAASSLATLNWWPTTKTRII
jgi:hypothetical protein